MRVTQQSQMSTMRADLASVSQQLAEIQRKVASGRELERASDNPADAIAALRYRRTLRSYEQFDRNIGDATRWLGTADSTLQAVDNRLTRVRDLTIQADNGSLGPTARAAIATEMRTIAEEILGLTNTRHLGRPIFSGTSGGSSAYDAAGAYLGDDGVVQRTVASGTSFQVNATGPEVFGVENAADPMNGNVFQVIGALADRVENGEVVADALDVLEAASARVHTVQATFGARLASLEKLEARNQGDAIETRSALSEAEDVDLTEAILDLKAREASYTAALGVTGRILERSLLDFLR